MTIESRPRAGASAGDAGTDRDADTLEGVVTRVTFQNPDSAWAVVRLDVARPAARRGSATAVGVMPGVEAGLRARLTGAWTRDPKHGEQFRAEGFLPLRPETRDGIVRYLAAGALPGVGPATAKRLVKHFGTEVLGVLDHQPERLEEISGIGGKKMAAIRDAWRSQHADRSALIFLHGHGVTPALAARIVKTYGGDAMRRVRARPYDLVQDIHGVGFLTADRIAQAVGIAPHAPERAAAGLHHRLQTAADVGHTLMPEAALCAETAAQLAVPEAAVRAGLVQLLDAAHAVRVDDAALLARDPATADGAPRIALCTLREAEHAVAARLATLAAGGSADDGAPPSHDAAIAAYQDDAGLTLDPGQRRALVRALDSRVLVITGGPGTGKTTLVRGIVHVLRRAGLRLHLAAPTGRAAKRLTEATGVEGRTLHRLLAWNPRLGAFAHDADAPLETDLVIVDEASMLDVVLTRCLLEALPDDARLILVGDVDQLPSVGPGRVLGDLIDSGAVPVERLTTIFRQAQASRIVTSAHRVRAGEMPEIDGPDARDPSRDFFFLHRARPEAVVETVLEIVKNRIPRRFDVDPRRDLQVLTPMRRGPLGTQALNEQLQRVLNPESGPTLARGGRELRAGDRVMQLRNNYDLDVYNGDIGRVRAVLPRKPPSSDDDKPPPRLLVDVDGRPVPYDDSALDDLTLAYASTIHKSQGSEFPFVVVVLHDQHFIMLQRNLLYTAITRGRRFVVVVGSRRALQRAVRTREASRRQTLLTAQLRAATETGGGAG